MTALLQDVGTLVDRARERFADTAAIGPLEAARARLDEPLRVAIAGKVKAGKSTLLNALVGEPLAPTDAGECTRIVTWYRDGLTYRVTLAPRDGDPVQAPFRRHDGHLEVDLGGRSPDEVARLTVEWPSASLRTLTLIDTPGIGSVSTEVSARTHAFLTPDDGPTDADAVCYLMRHLHGTDVRFLESFHDDAAANATPMNAIAVLSRADEIGVARLDALQTAERIARRYRTDPKVRRLCQTVVPVAGLLAEAGATLRQDEHGALQALVAVPREELSSSLLSAQRFVAASAELPVAPETRYRLLERLGLFGVRLSLALLRHGGVGSAPELATALTKHSGIDRLREVLATQFAARADLLKARSALANVDAVLRAGRGPGTEDLQAEHERLISSTHAFAEARLLNAVRAGNVPLADDRREEAERLLGGEGPGLPSRLGVSDSTDREALHAEAVRALERWQRAAEHPFADRDATTAARVIIRSCEGILADLARPVPASGAAPASAVGRGDVSPQRDE